ncbi:uncharacterized protein LOC130589705 [Beta vulgaris subsp. vulgaris]|uniref:uncharacterized protein LOC130589705 n=1 Tax=Beta vulgaris subsp. vulgaris TaxID=3555 RepID=UPI0025498B4E|nr:uncharacterized protein LOC130589705 [Beta vulgaris subsp. vulgaris]
MGKTFEVANRLLEEMAFSNYHWSNNRGKPKNVAANATSERIEKLETKVDQIVVSNRNVELQLGQLANAINSRSQGALPSITEVNPKQHCNAVTLRNGKELSNIKSTMKENEVANESEKEKENYETEKHPELTPLPPVTPYVPPIPFPQRLKQTKLDNEFQKFLNMFKQLHINIPFIDALMQIPSYSKFLKEIMSKKKKLEKYETIALSEECASVSLMPLSICKKLGLHNIKSTIVSLQLVDRSIKYPIGILENVLIKVDKFIIPVDFIILDMDEDIEVPIILGRPFLATVGAIIDVKNGILTFEIGEEKVDFNIFTSSRNNSQRDLVCQVDIIEDMTKKKHVTDATNALLEVCLSKTDTRDLYATYNRRFGFFYPEIEKTARALRKQKRLEQIQKLPDFDLEYIFSGESDNKPLEMGDNNKEKPLRDYAMPNASGAPSSIVRPTISANNFELRLL